MRKLFNSELERKTIDEFKKSEKIPVCIVLDNVRSANNVGSAFRTGDAFLIEKVYLCGITATPPNKEIHKTALGATESVEWEYYNETLDAIVELKKRGYQIFSVEQVENSKKLSNININKELKYALVFGNEVNGVEQSVINESDACVEIEQYGTKHSLNVSVSVGIVIWEFFKLFFVSNK